MPPSSPPSEHDVGIDGEQPFLTNQDVEILHFIVSNAQNLVNVHSQQHPDAEPLPTFKALFAAYDTVLEENGINPWHDQTYFRFLLRMGGWPGITLFEKFESLLEELGIRLEFDEEGQGPQDITRDLGGADPLAAQSQAGVASQPSSPRGRPRRASFDSVYDAGDESTNRSIRRSTSENSKARPKSSVTLVTERRPSTTAANGATGRTQSQDRDALWDSSQHGRGRLTARNSAEDSNIHQKRERSTSSFGGLQVWRRDRSRDTQEHSGARIRPATLPEPADVGNGRHAFPSLKIGVSQLAQQATQKLHDRSPDPQMVLRADDFYHRHTVVIRRRLIRKWRTKALQAHQDHHDMEATAVDHDNGTLLRQALEQWRGVAYAKRHLIETERFFSHLERRADKARDLYLLTKAFTHWAQSALDEVQRTSVARRHILRTRYFNAWRDITAVNELKVRRQVLTKFIGIWRSRSALVLADNVKALSVHHENLARKAYWRWFWAFCDVRAPQWWARNIKRRCLGEWIRSLRERREKDEWTDSSRSQALLKRFLKIWAQRWREARPHALQASRFRREKLARNTLVIWQVATRLSPIATEVSNMRDWRIARTAFTDWVGQMRMERQAVIVNRLRVIRNSWTSWNDLLRRQTLASRIDERIVLQALYRWVLAERTILLQRLLDRRLKQGIITKLVQSWSGLRGRLLDSERFIQGIKDRSTLVKAVTRWKRKMQLLREREHSVFDMYAPRIVQETFQQWSNCLRHVRRMQQWSRDAEFYFLTSKTLKKLQAAVVTSQRQKRRIAYGRIRWLVKTNMATKVLSIWRQRTSQISDVRYQAENIDLHRNMAVAVAKFDFWRARTQKSIEMLEQAVSTRNRSLALRQLHAWQTVLQQRKALALRAELFAQARISALAAILLSKFSLLIFENKTRQEKAESWKDWKDKKHFRSILRHWIERTAQRKGLHRSQILGGSIGLRQEMNGEDDGGLTARAEDWTAFEEGLDLGIWRPSVEAQSSVTPLPGYLRTPSKAARAKALLKGSTTPATPRATPFERRLRSQMSSSRSLAIRAGFGKSVFGSAQGTIEDIQEVSPRLDNGDS
ncbi:MAG: hypothetical protein M1835_004776 [Candelina submexicana]|nr:MAG: hypothetical protein M1835_004776 [Candelina submexicana]